MSTQPGPANPAISLSTALEPYVDVKRAASYLSVAVKTLNEWARLEKVPAYPWGDGSRKTWRFKLITRRARTASLASVGRPLVWPVGSSLMPRHSKKQNASA
jgi:hypothetical protein